MAGGNAIRGSRIGAGPMGEAERGAAAPRQRVRYFCAHRHESEVTFAVEAAVPESRRWFCNAITWQLGIEEPNPKV